MFTVTVQLGVVIRDPLGVQQTSLPNLMVGQPVSIQLVPQGGLGPYVFTATSLPAGLSMNSAGLITGTPTTSGSSSIAFTISDSST